MGSMNNDNQLQQEAEIGLSEIKSYELALNNVKAELEKNDAFKKFLDMQEQLTAKRKELDAFMKEKLVEAYYDNSPYVNRKGKSTISVSAGGYDFDLTVSKEFVIDNMDTIDKDLVIEEVKYKLDKNKVEAIRVLHGDALPVGVAIKETPKYQMKVTKES